MNTSSSLANRTSCALPLGFAFIYFAWGATYLGVKFAIVDIPVLLMSGGRFFFAGVLLFLCIILFDRKNFRLGTRKEWQDASAIGGLLLVFGVGTGNWAQQYIDSSLAAMVFSGLPLWIILVEWLRPGGHAPSRAVAGGLFLGFVGIGIILAPIGSHGTKPMSLGISLLLILASISWASGAIFSRHVYAQGSPLLPVARQMTVAGALLLLTGFFHGDFHRLHLLQIHLPAWLGFAYLVLIGSLSGYPVYLWLMRTCPPAKAATIPYVNLLVAIFLGWSLGHELITTRLLIGTAIVLTSVALVLRTEAPEVVPPGD
jgi:drug/metabolite transporter (DMT)-like permease